MVLKQIKSQGVSSRPPSSPRSSPSWVPLRSAHPQPSQQGFPVGVTGCTAGSEPQNVRNRATAAPVDSLARPVPPSNTLLFMLVLAERTHAASLPAQFPHQTRSSSCWCWRRGHVQHLCPPGGDRFARSVPGAGNGRVLGIAPGVCLQQQESLQPFRDSCVRLV